MILDKIYRKYALIVSIALIGVSFSSQAQTAIPATYSTSAKVNYTRVWNATAPDASAAHLITRPVSDVQQSTQFYDGLGRPIQTVSMQTSPLGNDMIDANYYDPTTGLEINKYLPFVSNAANSGDAINDGYLKPDAFQQEVAFYNGYLSGQTGETSASSTAPNWAYGQINYETSPLERVLNTYSPGVSWVGAGVSAKTQYLLNTATDNVQKWNIGVWDIASPQSNLIPTSAGAYAAKQLYKIITTDERGYQTIQFKDSYGQVILKKQQISATTSDDGINGSAHSNWLCTYFVYDDFGNLRFVITPKEVQNIDGSWVITQALADELCYRYEYDIYNHLVVRKVPGTGITVPSGNAGEVWMVYDQRNRLVMQQDGNLRAKHKWQYFQYDNLDRIIATGSITDPTNYNNLSYHVSQAAVSANSNNVSTWPVLSSYTYEVQSQSFYDDYTSWMNASNSSTLTSSVDVSSNGAGNTNFAAASNTTFPYIQAITKSTMTRGLLTGSKTEILDHTGAGYIYSVDFYDSKGRNIQTQTLNYLGGKDIVTTQYDWSGRPWYKLVSNQYIGTTQQTHNVFSLMSYDPVGRLLTIKKMVNSVINGVSTASSPSLATIVSNQYDELGKLKTKTLAPYFTSYNTYGMEQLTYDYNIRGWLLGVNRNYAKTPLSTTNYFGYDLGYDKAAISPTGGAQIGAYTSTFSNGDLAGIVWKSKGDGVARKYDYTYDLANRLSGAAYNESTAPNSWAHNYIDYTVSGISYDANGNIGQMIQNGFQVGGSQQIDNLAYTYMNGGQSDKLLNVIDYSSYNANNTNSILGDLHYTGTKTVATQDFQYDADGNVTIDNNRATTSTFYDYYNLPYIITIGGSKNNSTIQYTYDAAGNKLRKYTVDKSVAGKTITTTTYYLEGFVYKTVATSPAAAGDYADRLQYVPHEEGRIRYLPAPFNNANSTAGGFVFDYFITDNLGNVRMTLTDEPQTDVYIPATLEMATVGGGTAVSQESLYYNINSADMVANPSWLPAATNGTYTNQNSGVSNADPYSAPASNSQEIYQLCGNTANNPSGHNNGLGITLKVMAGDKISIYGKSVWHLPMGQSTIPSGSYPVSGSLATLLAPFISSLPVASIGHGLVTTSTITGNTNSTTILNGLLSSANNPSDPTTLPKAGINWILFDDQFRPVASSTSSSFDPVNQSHDIVKSHSILNIPMVQNGYLFIYCSNESNINVYFDNLQVVHSRGPLAEESHYYPFGLAMVGISDHAWNKQLNFEHFQGKEMQDMEFNDGSGLEEYDFQARYYDPQIGRWHTPDPVDQYNSPYIGMNNNPASVTDPDGKCPICILAAVGAVINIATHWDKIHEGGTMHWGALASAALVGAGAGIIGGFTGGAAFEALGVGGVAGGAFSGFVGGAFASGFSGVGNGIAFGDPFTLKSWGRDALFSGFTGGLMGGITSLEFGTNFWDGSSNIPEALPIKIEPKLEPVGETTGYSPADNVEAIPEGSPELLENTQPDFEFQNKNGYIHYAKHVRGDVFEQGKWNFDKVKPDMPDMSFDEYRKAATDLFNNNNAASFVSKVNGRLYKFDSVSGYFGVADPQSNVIISFFRPKSGIDYWIKQMAKHL